MKRLLRGVSTILKGACIGIANVIPGVSGGTIAVIVHIYTRLLESIGLVLRFDKEWVRRAIFLMWVLTGAILGVGLAARGLETLMTRYPIAVIFGIVGLIIGSVPELYRRWKIQFRAYYPTRSPLTYGKGIASCAVGLAAVVLLGLLPLIIHDLPEVNRSSHLVWFLVSGAAGGLAMIIPGISGALVLLLFGSYHSILNAINRRDIVILVIVALGGIVGVIIGARLIRSVVERYPLVSFAAIIGLVIGSPVRILVTPEMERLAAMEWWHVVGNVGILIAGIICSAGVARVSRYFQSRYPLHDR